VANSRGARARAERLGSHLLGYGGKPVIERLDPSTREEFGASTTTVIDRRDSELMK
jgi:hypothetical protein